MDKTSLFIIFQEYADSSSHATSPIIKSHDKIDEERDCNYFKTFLDDIEFFRYEVIDRFYDSNNLNAALYPYKILEEEYKQDGEYPNIALTVVSSLKAYGFEDTRQYDDIGNGKEYLFHNIDVTNTIIGKAAMENGHIDIDCHQQECHHISVLLQKESIDQSLVSNCELNSKRGKKHINIVSSLEELYEWLCENRLPQRIYIYNPKHGDSGHKAQTLPKGKKAAQLETDQKTTQQLLNKAIGTDTHSALWYYDEERKKYIYFENQNEIRLAFHAYHLKPGEENYDNIDRDKLSKIEGNYSVPRTVRPPR